MSSASSYPPRAPENGASFTATIHGDTYDAVNPHKYSDLRGCSVFISGASRGVGFATALACVAAGCRDLALASLERISDELIEELQTATNSPAEATENKPLNLLLFILDVRSAEAVAAVAAETARAFGGHLDILVNNAGFLEKSAPIAASDPDAYWYPFEVNLRGTYLVTRALLPLLLSDRGNGDRSHAETRAGENTGLRTLINVSSMGAFAFRTGGSAYQTSKWAVLKFTEFVMAEYADQGVLAYCVHPGGILTKLALNMPENTHAGLTDTPALAGDTIVFLAHQRREWLAGRYISCKWDMPEFLGREKEIVDGDKLKVRLVV
ncbi:oxidoreductase-like protein [Xylaria intraflava]|nr:oxidoreductase-like protein [Xylaria intraflava]